jgi:hypothetical protein
MNHIMVSQQQVENDDVNTQTDLPKTPDGWNILRVGAGLRISNKGGSTEDLAQFLKAHEL